MKNHFKYIKYYLLILVIFFIDKIILIPTIKLNFTNAAAVNPYQETLTNVEPPQEVLHKTKRSVWVFGSSRSMGFLRFPVKSQTDVDPYTTPAEKQEINSTDFEPFTYAAANPYLFVTRLHQLLDRGLKPDLIAVEVSPSYLNGNRQINNVITMEGIPLLTALTHPESYTYEMRKDILLSRLFATYRYKTDFFALLTWRPRKEASQFQQLGGIDAFEQHQHKAHEKEDRPFADDEWNDLPLEGPPSVARDQRLTQFTKFHEQLYFSGWQLDRKLIDALASIANSGQKNNIPVLFFKPVLYTDMIALKTKYGYEKEVLPHLLKEIQPYNGIYIDLNSAGIMKCKYFTDASHLSDRCFTEMAAKLIEAGRLDLHSIAIDKPK